MRNSENHALFSARGSDLPKTPSRAVSTPGDAIGWGALGGPSADPAWRDDVVAAARRMVGTPYRHLGRQPGVALDCLGLVIEVARECAIVGSGFDIGGYTKVPDEAELLAGFRERCREVSIIDPPAGAIGLFMVCKRIQHCAVLTGCEPCPGMIHAYAPAHKVVEHWLDARWRARLAFVFVAR